MEAIIRSTDRNDSPDNLRSMERFVAVLIENTAGKFPLWLAPEKAVILPISEKIQ